MNIKKHFIVISLLLAITKAELFASVLPDSIANKTRSEQFNYLYFNNYIAEANDLLDQWANTGKQNGDYYACRFNYYLNYGLKSMITISTDLPVYAYRDTKFTFSDTADNEQKGFIYNGYIIVDSSLLDSAINWIKLGIKKCPNRLDLYLGLVECYFICNENAKKLDILEQTLIQQKRNKGKWLWLEDIAVVDIFLNPLFDRFQEELECYLQANRFEEAEQLIQLARKYYPKRAEFVNDLGVIHYFQENYETAVAYFQKALELNPNDELIKKNICHIMDIILENRSQKYLTFPCSNINDSK